MEMGAKIMRSKVIIFIKNILDILIANYYLNKPEGKAFKIGIIGVVTSIIGICQSLKVI